MIASSFKRLAGLGLALALVALVTPACSATHFAFRADDRLRIVAPGTHQQAVLPVEVRWETSLPPKAAGGPSFAVFVDRAPVRPGQSLRAVGDDACRRDASCPDAQYLRERYVFLTDGHSVTVDTLPQESSSARERAEGTHEATVVLIDSDGRRVGETAYVVEFRSAA